MIREAGQRMKSTARRLVASIFYLTGNCLAQLKGRVAILMYHRIVSEKELQRYIQPGMYVRNHVFEAQMKFVKENFEIISFNELLKLSKEKKWDKEKRYCAITFDDGWLDNYTYAYPVLKKNDIPATIFLPTAFIETHEWFWPEKMSFVLWQFYKRKMSQEQIASMNSIGDKHPWLIHNYGGSVQDKIDSAIETCKVLRDEEIQNVIVDMIAASRLTFSQERLLMNWAEIREMSESGISFGSHSCNHKILTRLSVTELKKEIEDSMAVLQARGLRYVPVFCYPNGDYTPEIADLVKKAGYEAAITTVSGIEDFEPQSIFSLRRIGIHNDISKTVPLFAYRLCA